MKFEDFTQMNVWQLAFRLLVRVYELTREFPPEERFGMVSDMRRAANSITHNIAEGFGRYEAKDKTRFYKISRGSSYELMSQSFASYELKFIIQKSVLDEIITSCKAIIEELNPLIKSLETRGKPRPQPQP